MSHIEGLIYPPGWREGKKPEEELAKGFLIGLGREFADIAIKWGARYVDMDYLAVFKSKDWGIEPALIIEADARPDRQSVFVRKTEKDIRFVKFPRPDEFVVPLAGGSFVETTPSGLQKVVQKEEGFIAWDQDLPFDEALFVFEKIHLEAEKKSLFDPETRERKPLPEPVYIPQEKFKVGEMFAEKGGLYPLFGMRPEDALSQFDHPEELVVRHEPYTGEVSGLVHKRDLEYLDLREKIVNEIFLEKGITYAELIESLTLHPEVVEPIFKEIQDEAKKRMENIGMAEEARRAPPREDPAAEECRPGVIAFYEGRTQEAKRIFEQIMEKYPNSSYVPHDYAALLIRLNGDYEGALPLFIKSTQLEPKKALHFFQAAKCLAHMGRYKEAAEQLEKTLQQPDYNEFQEESGKDAETLTEALRELQIRQL